MTAMTMIGNPAASAATDTDSLLLDAGEAAKLCGMSRAAWYKRLASGQIPRPVKIGSISRWRRNELLHWIDAGCPARTKWDAMNAEPIQKSKRRA